MNFPDMSNYPFDAVSMIWGAASGVLFCNLAYLFSLIFKSAFSFVRWYITRKNLRKSSSEVINAFEEYINREDG